MELREQRRSGVHSWIRPSFWRVVGKVNKCEFWVHDKFLWIKLPSGRKLAYREPQLTMRETDFGPKKTIEFFAINSKTKKWSLERTWGVYLLKTLYKVPLGT
jgi:hypothetical protein